VDLSSVDTRRFTIKISRIIEQLTLELSVLSASFHVARVAASTIFTIGLIDRCRAIARV
jgi:hypothetical protein